MPAKKKDPGVAEIDVTPRKMGEEFRALSHRILRHASQGVPRADFLQWASRALIEFSECAVILLWVRDEDKYYRCEMTAEEGSRFTFQILPHLHPENADVVPCPEGASDLERLSREVLHGHFDPSSPNFTDRGSFWTGDTSRPVILRLGEGGQRRVCEFRIGGEYSSIALIPLLVVDESAGLMQMKAKQPDYFTESELEFYERVGRNLGVALIYHRAQSALRERVKELTCLYGIAKLSERQNISTHEMLQSIVDLLPPAWQYPEIASARIILDGRSYTTEGFQAIPPVQSEDIVVLGEKRGSVGVAYSRETPEIDEGPFLKDERRLLETVAGQIGLVIERRKAEEDRLHLEEQLRHADRLATIGQLAAGVAHELNEPLGTILGFAQLVRKGDAKPKQTARDIERITSAALHAREVVRKLMMFARQTPPNKTNVDLNQLVDEGLYFLESRCAKGGIQLVRSLSPALPEITADPAQLRQVLVNLAVNAMQAMPRGGTLTISTHAGHESVSLVVQDTGIGMTEETMKQIFIPFFTTKDVGEGTGLGLAVVHGIVTSHRGAIRVESRVGQGSLFEVELPVSAPSDLEESDRDDKKTN
jgi:two-component system NtrC family sensor kinase